METCTASDTYRAQECRAGTHRAEFGQGNNNNENKSQEGRTDQHQQNSRTYAHAHTHTHAHAHAHAHAHIHTLLNVFRTSAFWKEHSVLKFDVPFRYQIFFLLVPFRSPKVCMSARTVTVIAVLSQEEGVDGTPSFRLPFFFFFFFSFFPFATSTTTSVHLTTTVFNSFK